MHRSTPLEESAPRYPGPPLDVFPTPDAAGGDDRLGLRESGSPDQLVGSLAGDTEHFGDFREPDEVVHAWDDT